MRIMKKLGVKEYFDKYAKHYETQDRESFLWYNWFIDNIMKECMPVRGNRILDLGTGSGIIAIRLAERAPYCRVIGIDVSNEMLKFAEKKARDKGLTNIEFRTMEIEDMDLQDHSLDLVVSNMAIDHVKGLDTVISKIFKSLKSGRKLVIGLFFNKLENEHLENVKRLRESNLQAAKRFDEDWKRFVKNKWLKDYQKEHPEEVDLGPLELRDILKKAGFRKLRVIVSPHPEMAVLSGTKP